jgi:hypothetical protein
VVSFSAQVARLVTRENVHTAVTIGHAYETRK